ncbi:MAG: phosphatidate cytidylyltransferase, partial [Pontibacterium sp.]
MVKTRVVTAAVLASAVLALLFLSGPVTFTYFVDFVLLLGAWEWARLAGFDSAVKRVAYVLAVGMGIVALHMWGESYTYAVLGVSAVFWLFAFYAVCRYPEPGAWQKQSALLVMGLFTLLPVWIALFVLKSLPSSNTWISLLFLMIWAADTGAFFAGRRFGKAKLAPNVSPGKTREGFYGGVFATLLVALVYAFALELTGLQWVLLMLLALLVAVVSVLGDLFESMIKRNAGIKDSGNILPG